MTVRSSQELSELQQRLIFADDFLSALFKQTISPPFVRSMLTGGEEIKARRGVLQLRWKELAAQGASLAVLSLNRSGNCFGRYESNESCCQVFFFFLVFLKTNRKTNPQFFLSVISAVYWLEKRYLVHLRQHFRHADVSFNKSVPSGRFAQHCRCFLIHFTVIVVDLRKIVALKWKKIALWGV